MEVVRPESTPARGEPRPAVWLPDVLALVREAGDIAMRRFGQAPELIEKGLGDWASDTDLEIEEMLRRGLHAILPGSVVVGEEAGLGNASDAIPGDLASGPPSGSPARFIWHVDPIDGSANFIRGIPHFASVVSLSERLVDGQQRLLIGVTHDPCRQECFTALDSEPTRLNGKVVRVSDVRDPLRALLCVVTPKPGAAHGSDFINWLSLCMPRFGGLRRSGAMALDLAWLACGRVDAFAGMQLSPWDIAAGLLQVRQAGGVGQQLPISRTIPDSGPFDWCLVANSTSLFTTLQGDTHAS